MKSQIFAYGQIVQFFMFAWEVEKKTFNKIKEVSFQMHEGSWPIVHFQTHASGADLGVVKSVARLK